MPVTDTFDAATKEIVITPSAPLAPGEYQLFLSGSLQGLDGTPIGADQTLWFRVAGSQGDPTAADDPHDTVSTATDLGDVAPGQFIQVVGAIGNDPNAILNDPNAWSPFDANNIDMYHFQISAAGLYALGAEVFAGRIGSPLDTALTLFRLNPDGSLTTVAGNGDTQNTDSPNPGIIGAAAIHRLRPLRQPDARRLLPGRRQRVRLRRPQPRPRFDRGPTANGDPLGNTFDPETSYSGQFGDSVGGYVLNFEVELDTVQPQVQSLTFGDGTPVAGAVLTEPPQTFTVQFSAPMNLQELAFESFEQGDASQVSSVFLTVDGQRSTDPQSPMNSLRLESYDPVTDQATFLLLGALNPGTYELHLSGPQGLTDLAGNPLAGNDPASGDYVASFTVNGSPYPDTWASTQSDASVSNPQVIGPLFPDALVNGVTITGPAAGASTTAGGVELFPGPAAGVPELPLHSHGRRRPHAGRRSHALGKWSSARGQ